jgi:hypothetical protein
MDPEKRDVPHGETIGQLIRHPLRAHVFAEYAQDVTSPSRIAAGLSAPLNVVSHHTNFLLRKRAIELVRTEPRRGATEHFYRAVFPVDIEDADWARLPVKLRRVLARTLIDDVTRDCADVLAEGGMDDASTHLSRSYLVLDRRAEKELAALLREIVARANAIAAASRDRTGAETVSYELVIMSFGRASRP